MARRRAEASEPAVRCRRGTAHGAVPRATRRAAQKPPSNCTGTGTVGTPARRTAAVVPAPAWWTTAAVRGNRSACGTSPTVITSSSSPRAARPAQPCWMMPRSPAVRRARTIPALRRSASGTVALPRPTNTGGGPAARNSSTSPGSARVSCGHQYPATSSPGRQSFGRATTRSLKPCSTGQRARSWARRPAEGPRRVMPCRVRSRCTAWVKTRSTAEITACPLRWLPTVPNDRPPSMGAPNSRVGCWGWRNRPALGKPSPSAMARPSGATAPAARTTSAPRAAWTRESVISSATDRAIDTTRSSLPRPVVLVCRSRPRSECDTACGSTGVGWKRTPDPAARGSNRPWVASVTSCPPRASPAPNPV